MPWDVTKSRADTPALEGVMQRGYLWHPVDGAPGDGQGAPDPSTDSGIQACVAFEENMVVFGRLRWG